MEYEVNSVAELRDSIIKKHEDCGMTSTQLDAMMLIIAAERLKEASNYLSTTIEDASSTISHLDEAATHLANTFKSMQP